LTPAGPTATIGKTSAEEQLERQFRTPVEKEDQKEPQLSKVAAPESIKVPVV
jgi:hypothetical protein